MSKNRVFLTVKEASKFANCSEITIRRLIKKLSKTDYVKNSDKAGQKAKYRISKDYLSDHFLSQSDKFDYTKSDQKVSQIDHDKTKNSNSVINRLEEENQFLKKQIEFYQDQQTQTLQKISELIKNQQTLSSQVNQLSAQTNRILLEEKTNKQIK